MRRSGLNYLLLYLAMGLALAVSGFVAWRDTPPLPRLLYVAVLWVFWPLMVALLIREKWALKHIQTYCAWCGEVMTENRFTDLEAWREHALVCQKHPLRDEINRLIEERGELMVKVYTYARTRDKANEEAQRYAAERDALKVTLDRWRVITCTWCGMSIPYDPQNHEEVREKLNQHALECEDDPRNVELIALREQLKQVEANREGLLKIIHDCGFELHDNEDGRIGLRRKDTIYLPLAATPRPEPAPYRGPQ